MIAASDMQIGENKNGPPVFHAGGFSIFPRRTQEATHDIPPPGKSHPFADR